MIDLRSNRSREGNEHMSDNWNKLTSTELDYDPADELTDEQFKTYYPDNGDLPTFNFSDDDLAFRYSTLYKRCVYDDDTHECVFCKRADH